jgi:hypothetical protein
MNFSSNADSVTSGDILNLTITMIIVSTAFDTNEF